MSILTWGRGWTEIGPERAPSRFGGMRGVPALLAGRAGEPHLYFFGNLLHQGNGSHFRSLRLSPFQDFNPIDRFQ